MWGGGGCEKYMKEGRGVREKYMKSEWRDVSSRPI